MEEHAKTEQITCPGRYNYAKKRTCKSITTSLSTLEVGGAGACGDCCFGLPGQCAGPVHSDSAFGQT